MLGRLGATPLAVFLLLLGTEVSPHLTDDLADVA
jgi:hypothetical protein